MRKPVELEKPDLLFRSGLTVIARESTARKTTVCSNDPATCVSQVNKAFHFFAMFFRHTVVIFYQIKEKPSHFCLVVSLLWSRVGNYRVLRQI